MKNKRINSFIFKMNTLQFNIIKNIITQLSEDEKLELTKLMFLSCKNKTKLINFKDVVNNHTNKCNTEYYIQILLDRATNKINNLSIWNEIKEVVEHKNNIWYYFKKEYMFYVHIKRINDKIIPQNITFDYNMCEYDYNLHKKSYGKVSGVTTEQYYDGSKLKEIKKYIDMIRIIGDNIIR